MQAEGSLPMPGSAFPRAPFGPSVTWTLGMPSRSTATVDNMSSPEVRAAFSSSVSASTNALTSVNSLPPYSHSDMTRM